MNFLILVGLTVCLGIASCDEVCMLFKIARCYLKLGKRYYQNPLCVAQTELTKCIGTGAKECGMELDPYVEEMKKVYTETCTEGTEMNRLFKEHSECIFRSAALESRICMSPVTSKVYGLGFLSDTRENKITVLQTACRHGRRADLCIQDNINSTCGPEAAEFQRRLNNPSIELSSQACRAIDDESNAVKLMSMRSIYDFIIMMPPRKEQPSSQPPPNQSSDQLPPYQPPPGYLPHEPPPQRKARKRYEHHRFAVALVPQITSLYLSTTVAPHSP